MILKVERQFRDKYTKELHKVDETFEVSKERAEELLADPRGLVSEAEEQPKAKAKKTKK